MSTLLGHLSQFATFFKQGELLCSQGLAYLLGTYPDARVAFLEQFAAPTGIQIDGSLTWHAEAYQDEDQGRPDLEARLPDGRPAIKIEAKLGASFSRGQLKSYAQDLQERSGRGLLLVLVPEYRRAATNELVRRAFGVSDSGPWQWPQHPSVMLNVVTWEDVLGALESAGSDAYCSDLAQLAGMYRALGSYEVKPLAGHETLLAWREHEKRYIALIDQVTRRLNSLNKLLPIGIEPLAEDPPGLEPKGYHRRYVCRALGPYTPCCSIGVRDPFEGHETPIWLRFSKATEGFDVVRSRLETSAHAPHILLSEGSIWMPLDVPPKARGKPAADALVEQAERIIRVVYV